jgi:hypothetical protein
VLSPRVGSVPSFDGRMLIATSCDYVSPARWQGRWLDNGQGFVFPCPHGVTRYPGQRERKPQCRASGRRELAPRPAHKRRRGIARVPRTRHRQAVIGHRSGEQGSTRAAPRPDAWR